MRVSTALLLLADRPVSASAGRSTRAASSVCVGTNSLMTAFTAGVTASRIQAETSESTNAVKIELQTDLLRVSSQNPDLGEAKEEIVVAYQGTPLQIGFNARYLMDILQVIDTPQVRLELCDELSPGVLKPATDGTPESRYTAVVMPMRI